MRLSDRPRVRKAARAASAPRPCDHAEAHPGDDARIETRSVEEAIAAFEGGFPVSGFTGNIQGDLALSANKLGLRIEPMAAYRSRRKGQRGNTCE